VICLKVVVRKISNEDWQTLDLSLSLRRALLLSFDILETFLFRQPDSFALAGGLFDLMS
jgi:hypothetical protein